MSIKHSPTLGEQQSSRAISSALSNPLLGPCAGLALSVALWSAPTHAAVADFTALCGAASGPCPQCNGTSWSPSTPTSLYNNGAQVYVRAVTGNPVKGFDVSGVNAISGKYDTLVCRAIRPMWPAPLTPRAPIRGSIQC
jgi:hypothetical protein